MARRNLSKKDIESGVKFIHSKFVDDQMSSRDVAKLKDLPFSLTTYYKYLPKYEKNLKKSENGVLVTPNVIYDDERTPTKAIAENKAKDLETENQELLKENMLLTRFIVKKFIAKEMGGEIENHSENGGIH